jgi:hypothetical protein
MIMTTLKFGASLVLFATLIIVSTFVNMKQNRQNSLIKM